VNESSKWGSAGARPTISDVAALTGLSKATVSRAINNTGRVSQQTRATVLQTLDEIGYRRSHAATSLSTGRTGMIGLIIGANRNPTALSAIQGATAAAERAGYAVVVYVSDSADAHADIHHDLLTSRAVDGVVHLFPRADDRGTIGQLRRGGLPVVVIDPQCEMDGTVSVWSDARDDGLQSTEHLLVQGHRRIAVCADVPGWGRQQEYVEGYKDALEQAGAPFDPQLVSERGWDFDAGRDATTSLLSLPEPPTGVIYCCDTAALGGLAAAVTAGRRVPDDLALVAYDDTEVSAWVEPALSTLTDRRKALVEQASELLTQIIGGSAPIDQELTVRTTLRLRASSLHTRP
jgi:LacI family transcriptional regulator